MQHRKRVNTNARQNVPMRASTTWQAGERAKGVVRITAGALKGHRILTPGGYTHPMGERERLALFNMIMAELPDATVLDAYAGSGALGITALSLGAKSVIFIEKSPQAAAIIGENLRKLGVSSGAGTIYNGTVDDFVISSTGARLFQVALVDPPYDDFRPIEVKNLAKLVVPGGVLILSHPGAAPVLPGLDLTRTRQYAAAHISLYRKSE